MDEPCPSAEMLASYGDGKLTAVERREVERHLAACEDCFELFAGAAAFRLEEAAESHPVAALPAPRPDRRRWWQTAASAAVLATGVWIVVASRTPAPTMAWIDGLGGPQDLQAAAVHVWNGGSGLGFSGGLPADKRAFRLGVHLVDARVALGATDDEHWDMALEQAATLVPSESELARILSELRAGDGTHDNGTAKADELDQLVKRARAGAPEAFDLGAWAEAGRLAALGRRTGFLESELADRLDAADWAAGQDPVVAREIEAIRDALGDHRVSTVELSRLQRSFEQLILVH
ncbi:MAG TPA: zf-HC2 domain-containing protein [Thermoanaerobaculia bacterium]|nr:zf-HC2 domain-containing protein [Thermoanaerobaculia bacterium]